MIINKYCDKCGMYLGEQDNITQKILAFDKETVYNDKDNNYRCKICNKII